MVQSLGQAQKTIIHSCPRECVRENVELLTLCYECEQLLDLQPFCLLFRIEEENFYLQFENCEIFSG
jgi:hypothetical protein